VPAATLAPLAPRDRRDARRARIALAVLLALGALSQAWILSEQLASNPLAAAPTNDAAVYWNWAGEIAGGKLVGRTPFLSAPLYPYLVGAVRALGGGLAAVYALQAVLHLATIALLFHVGLGRFGFAAGLLGAALYLLLLEPAYSTGRILNGTLQLLLVVWAWDRMVAAAEGATRGRLVALGAVLGLNVLANPAFLAALPLVVAWLAWILRSPRPGLLAAGVAALVIAPATLHNWLACREVIAVSAQGGVTFYHGNAPGAEGVYHGIPGIAENRIQQNIDARTLARTETNGSWSATSSHFFGKGVAYWTSDPTAALRLFLRKLRYFATSRVYGDIYALELERADGLSARLAVAPLRTAWLVLPALVVLGWLARNPKRYFPEALLLLAPLATVLIFWYSPRYRMPALPILAALGGYGLATAVTKARQGALAPAVCLGIAFVLALASGAWNRRTGFDAPSTYAGQFQQSVGGALLDLGRLPEAEGRFRRALAEGHVPAAAALADVLRREGRRKDALEMLREAVARDPGSAYAHRSLAVALAEDGKLPEAEREFQATIAIDPNDWEALSNLGNVLHAGGRNDEAISRHRSALEKHPGFAVGHYNLGCVLYAEQRFAEAETEFREALRLEPGLVQAARYLEMIRNRLR